MRLHRRKAQSVAEYAILLAVVVSAVVGMQIYLRRGMQGRLKDSSDFLVEKINKEAGVDYAGQYEPYYRDTEKNITQDANISQKMFEGGRERKDYINDLTYVHQLEVTDENREAK